MNLTDEELISAIKSSDPKLRDWALYQFYSDDSIQHFAERHITGRGGNIDDVKDVFQEAICVFDRNIRQGKFEGKSSLKTYILAIVKWSWVTYNRKQNNTVELKSDHIEATVESVEQGFFKKEKKELLEQASSQLDERCQMLLRYYKLDYSMKEITTFMEFSSPAMAKKAAYRCREKLRKILLKNPALLKSLNIET